MRYINDGDEIVPSVTALVGHPLALGGIALFKGGMPMMGVPLFLKLTLTHT